MLSFKILSFKRPHPFGISNHLPLGGMDIFCSYIHKKAKYISFRHNVKTKRISLYIAFTLQYNANMVDKLVISRTRPPGVNLFPAWDNIFSLTYRFDSKVLSPIWRARINDIHLLALFKRILMLHGLCWWMVSSIPNLFNVVQALLDIRQIINMCMVASPLN